MSEKKSKVYNQEEKSFREGGGKESVQFVLAVKETV